VDEHHVLARIIDDGQGFDTNKVGRGLGLPGMRERVMVVGGELTIDSSDTGTNVTASIPIALDGRAARDQAMPRKRSRG
jgi:signal transduction histidine kinase